MNHELYTVMYGKQNQSVKMNMVMVDFVERYLEKHEVTLTSGEIGTQIRDALQELVDDIANVSGMTDVLFVQLFLGSIDNVYMASDLCKVVYHEAPSGKYMYQIVETYEAVNEYRIDEIDIEVNTLMKRILNTCPPSRRAVLPEDDLLAAVCMSRDYWKGQLR
jgi:hypothetical protein